MRVTNVMFDRDEQPAEITVALSLDELALLYRLAGHLPSKIVTETFGELRWGEALDDLATGAQRTLNCFFDDGADGAIPNPGQWLMSTKGS